MTARRFTYGEHMHTRITPMYAALAALTTARESARRADATAARILARTPSLIPSHPTISESIRAANRRTMTGIFAPPAKPSDMCVVDGVRRFDSTAPLPLETHVTRVLLTTIRRRVPSTRCLCIACAHVAFNATLRTIGIRGIARRISTRVMRAEYIESGAPCDACGRTNGPSRRTYPYSRALHHRMHPMPRD